MQKKLNPKISIIIVNYNTSAITKKCLTHVFAQRNVSFEVIVVDNGSQDDSVKIIKKNFPKVKLIENRTNSGLTHATNQAEKIAQGDYLLSLNSDAFLGPQALKQLLEFAHNTPNLGTVSPKLISPDGSPQPLAYRFPTITGAIREYLIGQKGRFSKYLPSVERPTKVDVLVEACLLIPRGIFNQIGGSNENFFLYFGDFDLCKRIKDQGLDVWYNPNISVIHELGASGKSHLPTPQYLKDSLTWPVRSIFKPRVQSPAQRYFLQDSIRYFGWPKHTFITCILWLSQKLGRLQP